MTTAGVRRVRDSMGLDAEVDTEFSRRIEHSFEHRCLANEVVMWWAKAQADSRGAFFTRRAYGAVVSDIYVDMNASKR